MIVLLLPLITMLDPVRRPIAFCPGYARGLVFLGGHALVGIALPRDNRTFSGLALDGELARRRAILVIDLKTGDTVHWVRFSGAVQEFCDVAVIPGMRRLAAIGFRTDEIRRIITLGASPAGT